MIESKYKVGDIFVYKTNRKYFYEIIRIESCNVYILKNKRTNRELKLPVDLFVIEDNLEYATKLEKALF